MYLNGMGVTQSYIQAKSWFEKAAQQNDGASQFNLGVSYNNGQGVARNHSKAKAWFKKSCENGYQDGCNAYKKLNSQ